MKLRLYEMSDGRKVRFDSLSFATEQSSQSCVFILRYVAVPELIDKISCVALVDVVVFLY